MPYFDSILSYDGSLPLGATANTHFRAGSITQYMLDIQQSITTNPDNTPSSYIELAGVNINQYLNLVSKPANQYILAAGLNFHVDILSTSVVAPDEVYGMIGTANHQSTLTASYVSGGFFSGDRSSTGAITELTGITARVQGSGAMSNVGIAASILADAVSGVANGITAGLYIRAQGTNHAIYSNGGKNFLKAGNAANISLVLQGAGSQTANLQEWQNSSNTVLSTISENGYFTTRKVAAPADAELSSSEVALWLDNTNGAGKLMIKAKTANGTVVSGSVTLS